MVARSPLNPSHWRHDQIVCREILKAQTVVYRGAVYLSALADTARTLRVFMVRELLPRTLSHCFATRSATPSRDLAWGTS
jgi:hypothetical protein